VPDHKQTEEAIRAAGVEWTFLRNAIYAEIMALGARPAIASGTYVTNAGDGRSSYVLKDDCAAAAAAVLTTPGHEGKAYDITGPEALSVEDIAALYAEAGGKPVEPLKLDDDAWIAMMAGHGMPEPAAKLFASFGRSTRMGYAAPVSTVVEDLTEVVEFYRMSGDVDYLLRVVVPDIAAYDSFYKKLIGKINLTDVSSSFAMGQIKYTTALPLEFVNVADDDK